jgi:hypothetical protein
MTNNCAQCGANLALVGRVHRCVPAVVTAQQTSVGQQEPVDSAKPSTGSTYRYRDPEKWRAYMRDYMRKRRAT